MPKNTSNQSSKTSSTDSPTQENTQIPTEKTPKAATTKNEKSAESVHKVIGFDEIIKFLESGEGEDKVSGRSVQLRKNCVDLDAILSDQLRFPLTQRKLMVSVIEKNLGHSIDIKNTEEFTNSFLDIIESDPSMVVDFFVSVFPKLNSIPTFGVESINLNNPNFVPVRWFSKTMQIQQRLFDKFASSGTKGLTDSEKLGIVFYFGMQTGIRKLTEAIETYESDPNQNGSINRVKDKHKDRNSDKGNFVKSTFIKRDRVTDLQDIRTKTAKEAIKTAEILVQDFNTEIALRLKTLALDLEDLHEEYETEAVTSEISNDVKECFGISIELKNPTEKETAQIQNLIESGRKLFSELDQVNENIADTKDKIQVAIANDDFEKSGEYSKSATDLNAQKEEIEKSINEVKSKFDPWINPVDTEKKSKNSELNDDSLEIEKDSINEKTQSSRVNNTSKDKAIDQIEKSIFTSC